MSEPTVPENNPPAVDIDAQAQSVADITGQTKAQVMAVLAALDQQAGEPLNTVKLDPVSGAVAHRVTDGGLVKWRVSHPTEGMFYEMSPAKPGWTVLVPKEDS